MVSLQRDLDSLQAGVSSQFDLLRIIAGIIGGIGCLGAGTLIQASGSIKGITTASTIWVVEALGIACGLGYYSLAGMNLLLALLVLSVFGRLQRRWSRCIAVHLEGCREKCGFSDTPTAAISSRYCGTCPMCSPATAQAVKTS